MLSFAMHRSCDYLFHIVMQKNEKVLRGLIGSLY